MTDLAGVFSAPASTGQRLLWVLDRYRSGQGALNCPVLCRLRGPLDVKAWRGALDDLVVRHEALRTTFIGNGPRLKQLIHDPAPMPLRIVDLSTTTDPESSVSQAVAQELATRVNPVEWPVRATAWRVNAQDHVFCLNIHHLVTDAASCPILFRDLGRVYARRLGETCQLDPPGRPYRVFAAWQQQRLASGELEPHLVYWSRQLDGVRFPQLPGKRPISDRRSVRETADIPEPLVAAVRAVAQGHRTTLFTVLLAAYYAQLHRVTGTRDLAVASLFANRNRPEFANTVGFFANMLVLRTRMSAGTVTDLLHATHRTVTGAFRHQEVPYQLLPPAARQASASRADDVVFQVIVDPVYTTRMGEVEAEALVPEGIGSRFELELVLIPRGGGFRAVLFSTAGRFPPRFAPTFLSGYIAMLGTFATAPQMPLAALCF